MFKIAISFQSIERFSNDLYQTNREAITLTNHNRSKQRDEPIRFLAITCKFIKAREISPAQVAVGFGFAVHWQLQ